MLRTHWRGKAACAAAALSVLALGLSGAAPAAAAEPGPVRINEIESNGGSPGDWVELVNTGTTAADVSGWVVKDNDNSHSYKVKSGTSIAPGGYLVLDVESSYGLGSDDEVRLYKGSTLIDSYEWSEHASTTYGRCADGVGGFATTTASTRGSANACSGGGSSQGAWPGGSSVTVADASNAFGENLSGLSFESAGVLWAANNGPGKLYRLVPNGSTWRADVTRTLRYANGSGDPDAEGVVFTPEGLFVATERDNSKSGTSLPKVLRFDPSGSSSNATAEWNLKPDLPSVEANSGPEGISWIPDSFLTAHGFRDERTGAPYSPGSYPGHGSGLFFVGLEANGTIYAYALSQGGAVARVATIPSGFSAAMDLEFEASTGRLWAACDDTCDGRTSTLAINAAGKFTSTAVYARPTGMGNFNNEGFAIAPTCSGGHKTAVWSDDANDANHALRSGTLNC
ncbi:lamin tail domain-containing protein [Kribbella sp. NPDC051770]|uniref:lamin tail domain-containing protein n=1 Tax=Kribbella sp. NPDC051770 TaxID=3155413 RepID=UPI003436915D